MPSSVQKGDDYIHTLALYIQANSRALASSPFPSSRPRPSSSSQQPLTSSLYSPFASLAALTLSSSSSPSTNAPKPLTLRLTPQTLFYLLLRFQASSIGTVSSVGRLDVPLGDETKRAMSFAEPSEEERRKRARERDRAETGSFRSALSVVSSTMSLGGWWGTSKAAVDPDAELKLIYSAFTKIPSLAIHASGLDDPTIEEMSVFGPLDTAVPLSVFKNLQSLEIISLPPASLLIPPSHNLRSLVIRDVESPITDEEGRWLIPVLFSGRSDDPAEEEHSRREAKKAARMRQPSMASLSTPMPELGEEDEEGRPEREEGLFSSTATPGDITPSSSSPLPSSSPPSLPPKPNFPHLSHLAFIKLSLLSFPPLPLPSLVSLDLSQNLLNTIPTTLSLLPSLLSLNLEGNMITSLRGADSILPSPSPPTSSSSHISSRSSSSTGLKALNLDNNRISNLHGLGALLALQRLSLRNNDLTDSLELSRLTVLPSLTNLYISPNPFHVDPAEVDTWRVQFWESCAKEGWDEASCPKVDGAGASWGEKRQMKIGFATPSQQQLARNSRLSASHQHQHNLPSKPPHAAQTTSSPPAAAAPPVRRVNHEQHGRRALSPPPKFRSPAPPPLIVTTSPNYNAKPSSSSSRRLPSTHDTNDPRLVQRRRRRHKRIINLDGSTAAGGEESDAATGTDVSEDEASAEKGKERMNGKGGGGVGSPRSKTTDSSPLPTHTSSTPLSSAHLKTASSSLRLPSNHPSRTASASAATLSSPSTRTSTPAADRRRSRISASVYEPFTIPTTSTNAESSGGEGRGGGGGAASSSGDEFRRRMEAMREEVGESWLRVLANSSANDSNADSNVAGSIGAGREERAAAMAGVQEEGVRPARENVLAPARLLPKEIGVTKVVRKKKKKKEGGEE